MAANNLDAFLVRKAQQAINGLNQNWVLFEKEKLFKDVNNEEVQLRYFKALLEQVRLNSAIEHAEFIDFSEKFTDIIISELIPPIFQNPVNKPVKTLAVVNNHYTQDAEKLLFALTLNKTISSFAFNQSEQIKGITVEQMNLFINLIKYNTAIENLELKGCFKDFEIIKDQQGAEKICYLSEECFHKIGSGLVMAISENKMLKTLDFSGCIFDAALNENIINAAKSKNIKLTIDCNEPISYKNNPDLPELFEIIPMPSYMLDDSFMKLSEENINDICLAHSETEEVVKAFEEHWGKKPGYKA